MEFQPHSKKSIAELLEEANYEPAELATLLDIDVRVILNAAFRGSLKATIVDHDVVSISRVAALDWMAEGQP